MPSRFRCSPRSRFRLPELGTTSRPSALTVCRARSARASLFGTNQTRSDRVGSSGPAPSAVGGTSSTMGRVLVGSSPRFPGRSGRGGVTAARGLRDAGIATGRPREVRFSGISLDGRSLGTLGVRLTGARPRSTGERLDLAELLGQKPGVDQGKMQFDPSARRIGQPPRQSCRRQSCSRSKVVATLAIKDLLR